MTNSLADKVVLVVGGSTGIGLATGIAFAEEGAQVVLSARREARLAAAKTLSGGGDKLRVRIADAGNREVVNALVEWCVSEVGPIDILVYSAGINKPKRLFADVEPEEFDQVMQVNATGAFNCMHAVLPAMRERGRGLIINVISLAGRRTMTLAGLPYCAAKFAQSSIGTFANLEAMPDGVNVTNLYPGETETPILDDRPTPLSAARRASMLQPSDVAHMAVAVAKSPQRAIVPEIYITPRHMPLA